MADRRAAPAIALLLTLALAPSGVGAQDETDAAGPPDPGALDEAVRALNILPPGQGRYLNSAEAAQAQTTGEQPPHNTDQVAMYDDLVQAAPTLTDDDLPSYFKDASLGVPDERVTREYSPRDGLTVRRDDFGVPHVHGETRADVAFGAGYVSAEDRLFMMDVLRHLGRGRVSELLGASPANLAMDRDQFAFADYTDEELEEVAERVLDIDPEYGPVVEADVESYIAGINAWIAEARADPEKLPAEYPALQIFPREFTVADLVASASLIGARLGAGGGQELDNAAFLDALEAEGHDPATARAIFDDLRLADDPEAPTQTRRAFPYNHDLGPPDPAAVARPDPGSVIPNPGSMADELAGLQPPPLLPGQPPSLESGAARQGGAPERPHPDSAPQTRPGAEASPDPRDADGGTDPGAEPAPHPPDPQEEPRPGTLDGPLGPIELHTPDAASNALLVTADRSASGRPLAVFGPQTGYWSPQILMEVGLYGPGIVARGAAFPGLSLYVLLGRGATAAWSATSAGGDQVDLWAQRLCDPDGGEPDLEEADHYVDAAGDCVALYTRSESFVAKPSGGGVPEDPEDGLVVTRTTQRTDLGIVQARATVDGAPVVYVAQRASYGAEVDSALAYVRAHDPEQARTVADLQQAFDRFSYTFNWFFVDAERIGWVLGGYHPERAPGVDLDLPNWGDAQWRWRARDIPFARTPHERDPARGYLTSWNNKQAPQFRSADSRWSWGPVQRVQLLNDRIKALLDARGEIALHELVAAMGTAATVDLRGDRLVPLLLDALGAPEDPRLARAADLLADWHAAGAHRRDLDGDGAYDHAAAVALMDAWWDPLLDAVFAPALGEAIEAVPLVRDDPPGPIGSAYNNGWYSQLHKDLRAVLGHDMQAPLSRGYCGGGALDACRGVLRESLDEAVAALEAAYGDDPDAWQADEDGDRIAFEPLGLQGQDPIQWQNRPTFQQVLAFGAAAAPPDREPSEALPATGAGQAGVALLALALAAALAGLLRRRRIRAAGEPDAT